MNLIKKCHERRYFETFKSLFESFADCEIVYTDRPDVLIVGEHKVIGVELTELHHFVRPGQTQLQAAEESRLKVVMRAEQLYKQSGGPPVICRIFMHNERVKKSQVEPLAAAISNLVIRNLPLPNESRRESYEWTNRSYFPEIINSIAVDRIDLIQETHFSSPSATWIPNLFVDDINRVLQAKESKYIEYKNSKRCDPVWLLIIADLRVSSTWFNFNNEVLEGSYISSFDRVFIMSHFNRRLHELRLSK